MREVARDFSGCRRQCVGCRGLPAVANTFVRAEDKHLVSHDRTACCGAELILNQLWLRRLKEAAGVQIVVAMELPNSAVNLIRALPAYDSYVRAGIASAVRGEVAGLYPELLNGVRRRSIHAGVPRRIVEVRPVEPVVVHVRAAAVYVHTRTRPRVADIAVVGRTDVQHARERCGEREDITSPKRQFDNPPVVDRSRCLR